jgi:AmiR/NasT family two-component response regulator
MYHNRIAAGHGRFERRYRRTDVIHDATSLLMARFGLDAGQAVAHLVRLSKQHSESIEAAAHMCVDAELRGVPQRAA